MSTRSDYWVCGSCGTPTETSGACPSCDAPNLMIAVQNEYLSEFPADSVACPSCGSTARPLVFRGWVRLIAFLFWAREGRSSAYICEPCARVETAKALVLNSLLGWWSVPSFFFYGWRATYLNWRSIWAPPPKPYEWGAISASEFVSDIREVREQVLGDAEDEWLRAETRLGALDEMQMALVLEADNLYEMLHVDPGADVDTIRRAYRARCKESHPDLHDSTARESTEVMIRLNHAWEVLRSPEMRLAYDWLEQQRSEQEESVA